VRVRARSIGRKIASYMKKLPTALEGPLLLEPVVHGDERGFFLETFRTEALAEIGIAVEWVQDNHSRSAQGVLRGMHFQVGRGQAKLVRCARGAIVDVLVDIRRDSPGFGRWEAYTLDDEAHRQLFVPVGFAHGFCVTSESADVLYKCSSYYDPEAERAIAYDDPDVGIDWPAMDVTVSERDRAAPRLAQIADELSFEEPA
jgi:dTDP-4-dehydrorhamnose 3,5-epimerase